ncbi:SDR family oxidoreductase [Maribellus sp. YY47]|uniref:SDR family oxidoreductase n=1 Tax=Maribellus sp. YY47 TaxID=2929486 RepID=UPI00200143C7|nr:SDR family oxidoreductase [Maribellus sp. YY47]MCK3683139.1 SDR family oxidoreductase [Maribellus sp. YY47]
MKTIVINGANGYVAANFINELLLEDFKIIALVRAGKIPAQERMINMLSDLNDGKEFKSDKLKVYDYSLVDENFSIAEEQLNEIFGSDVDYFHFAASLKYDFKAKDEIFQTNLDGVQNSMRVFSKFASKKSRFFFISTAYSSGIMEGKFEEKFYDNADISMFRNYYEQSKRFAENLIRKQIEEEGLNGHILRLSQVVGNNKTGVTKTDYGIFDFARRIQSMANRHPYRKVRVKVNPETTQNLIPIDTVVSYLMQVVKISEIPVIMNVVAKQGIRNGFILSCLSELVPISLLSLPELEVSEMDSYERIISIGMSFTASYTDTNMNFDTTKLDEVMQLEANEASEESIRKMLEYFLDKASDKKARIAS